MEDTNICRYCVAMKKGRKIFNIAVGCLMIFLSVISIILIIVDYMAERSEMELYTLLGVMLFPILFLAFGIWGVIAATKRVEIYKGKIVYHIGMQNKEFRMPDLITSKDQTETNHTGLYYEDIVPAEGYDRVAIFYDRTGKKIFRFGLSYDNVDRLRRDIANVQKSISKQKVKK